MVTLGISFSHTQLFCAHEFSHDAILRNKATGEQFLKSITDKNKNQVQLLQPFFGLLISALVLHESTGWPIFIVNIGVILCVAIAR